MNLLANTYVRVTNNFLHDMATGTWAACVLVLWVLDREAVGIPQEAQAALASAAEVVWILLLVALVVVTVTGIPRIFYWRATTPREELAAKRRALIIKHIAFLVIYGGGSWWAWTLV
ncbi:MAG: hypothetical protein M1565_01365 [Actinobacteria bacterium]|nr:hypothetical protein [Actinomycetota bacterium]